MKIIVVVHHLPLCVSINKNRTEAMKQHISRPLIESKQFYRGRNLTSVLKASHDISIENENELHFFYKPMHSTFLRDMHGDVVFLGIPGLFNQEIYNFLTEKEKKEIHEKFMKHKYHPILLDFSEFEGRYNDYSEMKVRNVCFCTFWNDVFLRFDEEPAFRDLKKLNQIYLEKLMKIYEDGDIVWIMDHEFWLLPRMIRDLKKEAYIGLSQMVPFPSSELFRCLPNPKIFLDSLLSASYIEFQNKSYLDKFIFTNSNIMGISGKSFIGPDKKVTACISRNDSRVFLGVGKIGIDIPKINTVLKAPECQEIAKSYSEKYKGYKILVSISTLNNSYTNTNFLMALEAYLHKYDKNIALIHIEIPEGNTDLEIKSETHLLKQFLMVNYPLVRIETVISEDDFKYYALLSIADLGIVLSERSAISRPCLDFIASQEKNMAPLIVSEFSHFNDDLNLIRVNPKNAVDIADKMNYALNLDPETKIEIHSTLINEIETHNIHYWMEHFIYNSAKHKHISFKKSIDYSEIVENYKKADKRLFLLDYDGTIQDICPLPEQAFPSEEIKNLLKKLRSDTRNEIYIITGRDYRNANDWFSSLDIGLYAEHGMYLKNGKEWVSDPVDLTWKNQARKIINFFVERTPGSQLEEKNTSMVFHYRNSSQLIKKKQSIACKNILEKLLAYKKNLEVTEGKDIIEIRVNGLNKGKIARKIIANQKYDFILAAGDDTTDQEMLEIGLSTKKFYSVSVNKGDSCAKFHIENPGLFRKLLLQLTEFK
ncbi:trehalose-phosphatase [Hamiltosporidium magnivora]|uniref:Trehalose-phosphatase n=2 Tax=Hamiltosporidium TaxID=1176354 RepID=A0A4Q9LDD0_9MICR|nr:trehalose-phosphatase [Hamiltosporidium magnivora]